jgi:3D (Asp-Asp-Asp) domain-containing protein
LVRFVVRGHGLRTFVIGLAVGLAVGIGTLAHAESLFVTGYDEVGVTASGLPTGPGIAACPPDLAFGQRLLVDGWRVVVCADRYSPALSRRIDLWVATAAEAYALTGFHDVEVLP